jgi:DNA polymerase-3 subunit epsilon
VTEDRDHLAAGGGGRGEARGGEEGGGGRGKRRPRRGGRGGRGSRVVAVEQFPEIPADIRAGIETTLDDGEFVVFDLETTGGNPERNGITEIFAIRWVNGEKVGTYGTLVNPGVPIPPIVRRMTGIDNKMVRNAPRIDEVMPDFLKFIGNAILVSHNTIGDMKFVRYFAEKAANTRVDNFFLCTHLLVERLAREAPDKSLKGLSDYFHLAAGELHRAEADAYLTLALFEVLLGKLKQRGVARIDAAIRLQGDLESGMRLGWAVPPASLAAVPQGPGVFFLKDHDGKVLFFAGASQLDRDVEKLAVLTQLPRQLLRLALRSYDVTTEKASSTFGAMLAECDALSRYEVTLPPSTWHQRQIQTVYLAEEADGQGLRLGVGALPGGVTHAWGPVRDRRIALELVTAIGHVLRGGAKAAGKGANGGAKGGPRNEPSEAPKKPQGNGGVGQDDRDSVALPLSAQDDVLAVLAGQVGPALDAVRKERRRFSLLFKPAARRALAERADTLAALAKLPVPARMHPLLDKSGVVVVPGPTKGTLEVHTVVGSVPRQMVEQKGDIGSLARDAERLGPLAADVAGGAQKGQASHAPLTAHEANLAMALLWWVYNARSEGRWLAQDELLNRSQAPQSLAGQKI